MCNQEVTGQLIPHGKGVGKNWSQEHARGSLTHRHPDANANRANANRANESAAAFLRHVTAAGFALGGGPPIGPAGVRNLRACAGKSIWPRSAVATLPSSPPWRHGNQCVRFSLTHLREGLG